MIIAIDFGRLWILCTFLFPLNKIQHFSNVFRMFWCVGYCVSFIADEIFSIKPFPWENVRNSFISLFLVIVCLNTKNDSCVKCIYLAMVANAYYTLLVTHEKWWKYIFRSLDATCYVLIIIYIMECRIQNTPTRQCTKLGWNIQLLN